MKESIIKTLIIAVTITLCVFKTVIAVREGLKEGYETDLLVAKENTKQDSMQYVVGYKNLSKQASVLESYEKAAKARKDAKVE